MALFQQQTDWNVTRALPKHAWGANPLSGPAVGASLIACDAWDTYGAQAGLTTGSFTPYQANPNGNVSTTHFDSVKREVGTAFTRGPFPSDASQVPASSPALTMPASRTVSRCEPIKKFNDGGEPGCGPPGLSAA